MANKRLKMSVGQQLSSQQSDDLPPWGGPLDGTKNVMAANAIFASESRTTETRHVPEARQQDHKSGNLPSGTRERETPYSLDVPSTAQPPSPAILQDSRLPLSTSQKTGQEFPKPSRRERKRKRRNTDEHGSEAHHKSTVTLGGMSGIAGLALDSGIATPKGEETIISNSGNGHPAVGNPGPPRKKRYTKAEKRRRRMEAEQAEQAQQAEQEAQAKPEKEAMRVSLQQTRSDAPSSPSPTGRGSTSASPKLHNHRHSHRVPRRRIWLKNGRKFPLDQLPKEKFVWGMIIIANLAESDFNPKRISRQSRWFGRGSPVIFSKYRFWIVVVVTESNKAFLAVPLFTHQGKGLQNKEEDDIKEFISVKHMKQFPHSDDEEQDRKSFKPEGIYPPLRTNTMHPGFAIEEKSTVCLGYMHSFRFTEHIKWFGNLKIDSFNCLVSWLEPHFPKQLKASDDLACYMRPDAPCDFGQPSTPQNDGSLPLDPGDLGDMLLDLEDVNDRFVEDVDDLPSEDWLTGKGFDLDEADPEVQEMLAPMRNEGYGHMFCTDSDEADDLDRSVNTKFFRFIHDYSVKHRLGSFDIATEPVDVAPLEKAPMKETSVDKTSVEQTSIGQTLIEEPPAEETTIDETLDNPSKQSSS